MQERWPPQRSSPSFAAIRLVSLLSQAPQAAENATQSRRQRARWAWPSRTTISRKAR